MRKVPSGDVDLTYIVSAFNRPLMLPVALWSIAGQGHRSFTCIVADNAPNAATAAQHKRAVADVARACQGKFWYYRTHGKTRVSDPYWAAEWIIKHVPVGRWLAFPCDDTYLVPGFGQRMLMQGLRDNADFVYCQWILTGPVAGAGSVIPEAGYRVWEMQMHQTAKTCFIVRRSVFDRLGGFQGKRETPGHASADYWFSSQIAEHQVPVARLAEIAVVHN